MKMRDTYSRFDTFNFHMPCCVVYFSVALAEQLKSRKRYNFTH